MDWSQYAREYLTRRGVAFQIYTDWHWCILDRFDYYPTKNKWKDRRGVYGTHYGLDELIQLIEKGSLVEPPPRPPKEELPCGDLEPVEVESSNPILDKIAEIEQLISELKEML